MVECVHSFKQQFNPDLEFFSGLRFHHIVALAILVLTLGY